MRRIVLDTETTGLNAKLGDRIIELGCVEIMDRRLSGNHFHRYVNPERESEAGALKVHGITNEFLQDKPKFREIASEFLDYVRGAELVIHNAPFDVEFLDKELALLELPSIGQHCAAIVDTLKLAKELHPGKRNSLDALCERYQIGNAHRMLHGALLDAELLAEVYLAMTRGQESLGIELDQPVPAKDRTGDEDRFERPALKVLYATSAELEAHETTLDRIEQHMGGVSLWRRLDADEGNAAPAGQATQ
ncbi:MAG: DNA polymerase III subunit epsilon [Betaproteobacteria bacterium RIFCSPLOWO2_02_FULL_63_19]|nr:MAG: DNA polymerase III subunit epsilon [Betaproteobacteria bacterium RIFCSPLOWO2_02_FULL_63_19]